MILCLFYEDCGTISYLYVCRGPYTTVALTLSRPAGIGRPCRAARPGGLLVVGPEFHSWYHKDPTRVYGAYIHICIYYGKEYKYGT